MPDKVAIENDLIQRATEGSLSAYSTTSFTKEQKNALARLIKHDRIRKMEMPYYSGAGNRYRYFAVQQTDQQTGATPVNLKWDDMHVQSREELLSGAGFNTKLATKKWMELEKWEQELLKDSLEGRSEGKVKLETALGTENKNNKAPWEMTREEWRDAKQPSYEFYKEMGWPEGRVYDREPGYRYGTSHLGWIKTAIHKGKKVPDEILRMYPELLNDETIRVLEPEAYKQIEKAIGNKPEKHSSTSLQSIESNRSSLSQSSDERQQHSLIIEPDDPRVAAWKRDPGRMDVRGVDTPARGTKHTKHKHSQKSPPTSLQGTR